MDAMDGRPSSNPRNPHRPTRTTAGGRKIPRPPQIATGGKSRHFRSPRSRARDKRKVYPENIFPPSQKRERATSEQSSRAVTNGRPPATAHHGIAKQPTTRKSTQRPVRVHSSTFARTDREHKRHPVAYYKSDYAVYPVGFCSPHVWS